MNLPTFSIINSHFFAAINELQQIIYCGTIHNMKRIVSIFFILILLLTQWGCAPAPVPEPAPVPAPTPTPVPTPEPPEVYTIAWMSDTQHYSREFPDTFFAMTEYLRDAQEELNLQYVIHTGDIVASGTKEAQWQVATEAMAKIAHIPAGVCAGNHDVQGGKAIYKNYKDHFGEDDCSYRSCYGGSFEDNRGHYDLIDVEGSRLLFLYMGFRVKQEGIDWMKSVIEQHPDRAVIICTHTYFDTNLSLLEDGRLIKEEIVEKYPNVYMVLGGHRYNVARVPEEFDDDGDGIPDRTVQQMICNYQAADSGGGSGYMMFFEVDEAKGEIRGYTYSPLLDDYVHFDEEKHDKYYKHAPESELFVIDIPWEYGESDA